MSSEWKRRDFIGLAGAAAAGLGVAGCAATQQEGGGSFHADLALINGRIYTVDDALPQAEAFAVKNGRFAVVGSNDAVSNIISAQTEVIDAAGMTVTPGFIDAHSHPSGVRELTGVDVNLPTIAQ
ncbi:MAG: amidohydrolase family protein, partial [Acidobacteriota bacterium]